MTLRRVTRFPQRQGLARAVFCAALHLGFLHVTTALEVTEYSPEVHDRFVSGFPKKPVLNRSPRFIGAGFDLSGVGWDPAEPTHSVTLITPRHFLYAAHQQVGRVGTEIHFANPDGALKRYVIAKLATVPFPRVRDGVKQDSDLAVGTFTSDIPAADRVTSYPVLYLGPEFQKYVRKRIILYGHTARIGMNEITDGVILPGERAQFHFASRGLTPGMAMVQSGDSGSPTFLSYNGRLTLVGTHSGMGVDTFIPAMISAINGVLAADGHTLHVLDGAIR